MVGQDVIRILNLRAIQCKFKNNPKIFNCITTMLQKICEVQIRWSSKLIPRFIRKKKYLRLSLGTTLLAVAVVCMFLHKNERRNQICTVFEASIVDCRVRGYAAYLIVPPAAGWYVSGPNSTAVSKTITRSGNHLSYSSPTLLSRQF